MPDTLLISTEALQGLLDALIAKGYQPVGPRLERGAIVYETLSAASDLPRGYLDEQGGGHYRLSKADPSSPETAGIFRYAVGPQSWKGFLFPSRQSLWRARRTETGFAFEPETDDAPAYAFLGARPCELAAMRIQDRVFQEGPYVDRGYAERRARAFVVAVNCTRAGGTCFCASMGTGPRAEDGFDLCLTELLDADDHAFLVEIGSASGRALMELVRHRTATPEEIERGRRAITDAAEQMGRRMPPDAAAILASNPEHPRWDQVAQRCLSCANCTLVCPTCFCSRVEDTTSLDGVEAARHRQWDSCFTLDFSYIHGGPVRRETAARYRHWITHKLSTWHAQFGTSGCTGCGRCITWCPVGIDITEEVAAIQATERAEPLGDE
ncbi:4Fe-4S dicluster domain-containing protein [Thiorhodococcus minor]|uniref:Sulfite reductase subunit A n=1 Tax=Thiorhodococcus minor TaxID=57489 RepID=A0A6M0K4I1_9GAMM|nr:4Fe-4S dicluster domain-containing protein [Thiorhodococcus minor]NEV64181.1 sulfite reductase subunit A [Thiorhodococcus minor]